MGGTAGQEVKIAEGYVYMANSKGTIRQDIADMYMLLA